MTNESHRQWCCDGRRKNLVHFYELLLLTCKSRVAADENDFDEYSAGVLLLMLSLLLIRFHSAGR